MILGVGSQVFDVDVWQAGNQKLEFLLVEDRNQSLRDDVVEAFQKCAEPGEQISLLFNIQLSNPIKLTAA